MGISKCSHTLVEILTCCSVPRTTLVKTIYTYKEYEPYMPKGKKIYIIIIFKFQNTSFKMSYTMEKGDITRKEETS